MRGIGFGARSAGGAKGMLRVQDVFATSLYTGNGGTQTITNGLDLAGKGGLVWTKQRNGTASNLLIDTVRGREWRLFSNTTDAQSNFTTNIISSFNSDGYSVTGDGVANNGSGGQTYASWSFRFAPDFFGAVTYTGNSAGSRVIDISALGFTKTPGLVVVKRTSGTENWFAWHRALPTQMGKLNLTDAFGDSEFASAPTATTVTLGSGVGLNVSSQTYIMYVFGHNTDADGVIQCGSYVGDGQAAGPTVTLGWLPQWVMIKASTRTGDWVIADSARGFSGTYDYLLRANTSGAETTSGADLIIPTSTGFSLGSVLAGNTDDIGQTYIYMAIRAPS